MSNMSDLPTAARLTSLRQSRPLYAGSNLSGSKREFFHRLARHLMNRRVAAMRAQSAEQRT